MINELEKDIFISQELRYYNLFNIFFDEPIKKSDLDSLKEIFFSINNVTQIYFRNNIDTNSIELIKYLLEISPTMEDARVEKYITDINNNIDEIFTMSFFNPTTWFIKTIYDENSLIRIDKYKEIKKHIKNILKNINKDFSQIEKVLYVYDYCKKIKLVKEDNSILNILKNNKASENDIIKIFDILLKELNIKSYVGESIVDGINKNITIIYIDDEKYNINGIYLFDIMSDYIDSDEKKEIKTLNYNYFGMQLKEYSKTIFNDRLIGLLNLLSHDLEYDLEKIRDIPKIDITKLEKSFDKNYIDIHNIIENQKEIKDEIKLEIIYKLNDKDNEIIKKNYYSRKHKIFNYNLK